MKKTYSLSEEVIEMVRVYAFENKIALSEVVEKAILEYINKKND